MFALLWAVQNACLSKLALYNSTCYGMFQMSFYSRIRKQCLKGWFLFFAGFIFLYQCAGTVSFVELKWGKSFLKQQSSNRVIFCWCCSRDCLVLSHDFIPVLALLLYHSALSNLGIQNRFYYWKICFCLLVLFTWQRISLTICSVLYYTSLCSLKNRTVTFV